MKRVHFSALAGAAMLASATGGSAQAACVYNDVYYDVGTVLCFDGWLQECTVASYWKAVGMCHAPDVKQPYVRMQPKDQPILARLTAERPKPQSRTAKR